MSKWMMIILIRNREFSKDMNGLVLFCISVFVFITCNCDEEETLEGANTCIIEEKYFVSKKVVELWPMRTKSHVFCWKVPPRCTKYYIKMVPFEVEKKFPEFRNVNGCCDGYKKVGDKCEPECLKRCVNGKCTGPGECKCNLGYSGTSCDEVCAVGKWGIDCKEDCECNNAACDPISGVCKCPPGRIGKNCEIKCPRGKYGEGCLNDCLCKNEARCHPESGQCICRAGYTGTICDTPCQFGHYGEQCALECHCSNGLGCDPVSGACACPPGFTGLYCEKRCEPGRYGEHCKKFCNCHNNATCNNVNGLCICPSGYIGEKCEQICPGWSYGDNCLQTCDCNGSYCNHITGKCNCPKYWIGEKCDQKVCPDGYYGPDCNQLCHCEQTNHEANKETSVAVASSFCHKHKHKQTRSVEIKILTKEERLIFQYVKDGDYKTLANKCAQGVNMNIADINDNYQTPLHLAAKKGCVFTLLTLLGCGVNINAEDSDGNTPLHIAVADNQSHICTSLLYNEANPFIYNKSMKNAYQLAMDSEDNGIKYIFQTNRLQWYQKIRKLKKDEKKLFLYVRKGYYGSVGDLCMKGVNVLVANVEDKENTAFHFAALYAQNIVPMVFTLLNCGGDINARNVEGNTPLHFAVMVGHVDATSILLQYGANPFIENNDGMTAHNLALESSDPSLRAIFNEPLLSWYLN
ncbi:unnamed protein product [Nezara viridula]|uniref:EGF-like domain-containing protein n=1 Tax=Nezara viridula TaxID=85310 RepID=A0A9P0MY90_NEZVI|nr:unnamed protein product [Nezara viridula]